MYFINDLVTLNYVEEEREITEYFAAKSIYHSFNFQNIINQKSKVQYEFTPSWAWCDSNERDIGLLVARGSSVIDTKRKIIGNYNELNGFWSFKGSQFNSNK